MIEVSFEPRQLAEGRDCDMAVRFTNPGPGTCTNIVFRLDLPRDFMLLRGRDRMEIPELRAGRSYAQDVLVRAAKAGTFAVRSANFSYRDNRGSPVRVTDFRAELTVVPAAQLPAAATPALTVEGPGDLVFGEWDALRVRVRNTSPADLRDLVLAISGPFSIAAPGPQARIPFLAAGAAHEISFVACPAARGGAVQLNVHTKYTDTTGRAHTHNGLLRVAVLAQRAQPDRAVMRGTAPRQATILYLAASPLHLAPRFWNDPEHPEPLARLRVDKEMEEIRRQLKLGRYADRFRFKFRLAASVIDISQALADHHPRIIHFSGHGDRDGRLYVEDEKGDAVPAVPEGLARLFRLEAATVDCVIVNACYSLRLAKAMSGYFDHVIGMRRQFGDPAAILFSIGFYQGLGSGATVPAAFQRGCALVQADHRYTSEHDTPVLLSRTPGGGASARAAPHPPP
jgi:hypothetical protein